MSDTIIHESVVTEQKLRDLAEGHLGIYCDECESEFVADSYDMRGAIEGADMIRRLREALAEARRK